MYPIPGLVTLKSTILPPVPTTTVASNPLPEPPEYCMFAYPLANPTTIAGGLVEAYPLPPLTVVIPVTVPAVPTVRERTAVEPIPRGFKTCTSALPPGLYPEPPPVTTTDSMAPAALMIAVPAAATIG